jgi:hypothetical protein
MGKFLFGLVVGFNLAWVFCALRRDHYWHEFNARRCKGGEITLAEWEAARTTFTEGLVQRGNGNGGPTTAKPMGYQPRPSRPGPNPPPSEP